MPDKAIKDENHKMEEIRGNSLRPNYDISDITDSFVEPYVYNWEPLTERETIYHPEA